MTAISPLQSIPKKGLFGDHYKKKENDLLSITEIKDLNIIQISQHKNSQVNLKSIRIDDLELSLKNLKVTSNKDTRIVWSAPNTWLVMSNKDEIMKDIEENCDSENFAVTNISHSRAVIQLEGFNSKEVLKKGCPINFNEFKKNSCAGSVFSGITIVVDCIEEDPLIFNIIVLRSFGESLYHHVTDAALEFGYEGV